MNEQLESWQKAIKEYEDIYFGMYGHQPSEKFIGSFCEINRIPWPLPKSEEFEMKESFTTTFVDISFGGEGEG